MFGNFRVITAAANELHKRVTAATVRKNIATWPNVVFWRSKFTASGQITDPAF